MVKKKRGLGHQSHAIPLRMMEFRHYYHDLFSVCLFLSFFFFPSGYIICLQGKKKKRNGETGQARKGLSKLDAIGLA